MIDNDKKDCGLELEESGKMKINPDGSITIGCKTFSSMENFAASIRKREEELKK